MNGVPESSSFNFIVSKTITLVAFGNNEIIIYMNGEECRINIESDLELCKDDEIYKIIPGRTAGAVALLCGETVRSATRLSPISLKIEFANNDWIQLFDNNSQYESFVIADQNHEIVV